MNKNCALKLVDEIILYYDARSNKHKLHSLSLQKPVSQCCILQYPAVWATTHTKMHTHILWTECRIFRVFNTVVEKVLATHYRVELYRLTALGTELLHESLNGSLCKQRHTSSNTRLSLTYIYLQTQHTLQCTISGLRNSTIHYASSCNVCEKHLK